MKKIIFALSTIVLFSCSKESVTPLNEENLSIEETTVQTRRYEPTVDVESFEFDFQRDLIAGQHYTIGTVDLVHANNTLTVTYNIVDPNWTMVESHLYVGACGEQPMNNNGNPKVGRFPYKEVHENVSTYSYVIDATDLATTGCIAAHAVVVSADGLTSHTAWGAGDPYAYGTNNETGNNWAMIFGYEIGE